MIRARQLLLRVGAGVAVLAGTAFAQEPAPEMMPPPRPLAADLVMPENGLLSADELDELLAPIALFPDPLLTQILVAATVPLDLVKADRWVAANAGVAGQARSAATEAQAWEPSVAVLAAGFPTVVQRMAADLDATETLGSAVLAQTDDVLDSVQRLRAQAAATGYLASNDAQTISENPEGDIAVTPADPGVVYVPSYDPAMAFTTAPTAQPVVTTEPVYVEPGYDTGSILATGAIAFGTAMLVDEIFDDDDDWDDYWGPGSIDWDNDEIYHRPDIDVEGDVNIDRDRIVVDRDRIGAVDPDRVRDGSWKADPAQRAEAQARLEQRRSETGREGAQGERLGADGGAAALGATALGATAVGAAGGSAARARLEKSSARREAGPPRKATMETPFSPKREGAPQVDRARDRGATSVGASRAATSKPKPKAKSMSKPSKPRPAVRSAPKKSSAFKKSASGSKARSASNRGRSSAAKRSGGGRRR